MLSKLNLKWHVLIGGFFSYMFDAMDILLLAVALPAIRKDLSLTLNEGGMLVTATLIGVGLSSIIIGWFADNYGRRRTLIFSLLSFGLLTALIALSTKWWHILLLRFLAGLGLGGVWSIIVAYVTETWPCHQRGRAAAFVMSSFPVGAGLAAFLAYLILPEHGWRVLFLCGGIAVFAALYIYMFIPESEAWLKQRIRQKESKTGCKKVSIGEIFKGGYLKITILATLASALSLIGYWGSTTWLPTFLVDEKGLEMSRMAFSVIVLNIGMFVGYNVFGFLSDEFGRRIALIISLVGTAIALPVYISMNNHSALLLMGPLYAFFMAFVGLFGSYLPELYPTRIRATGAGFCFNIGRGFSALAPVILASFATGYGLKHGIMLCAVFFFIAAIVIIFLPNTCETED